jgi:hypothetical protein
VDGRVDRKGGKAKEGERERRDARTGGDEKDVRFEGRMCQRTEGKGREELKEGWCEGSK